MKEYESRAIDWIRFPLSVAVVFIHSGISVVTPVNYKYTLNSSEGLLNFLKILFGKTGPLVAVPLFFMFSAWLLYKDNEKVCFNWYRKKMRKRFASLILPYLIWNTIAIIPMFFLLHNSCLINDINSCNWRHLLLLFWSYNGNFPLDFPLWFIRDLFILHLISPLIFVFVKKIGIVGIVLLALIFVINIVHDVPGFTMKGLYAYTIGIYVANYGRPHWSMGTLYVLTIFLFLVLFLTSFYDSQILNNFYIVLGMFIIFEWVVIMMKNHANIKMNYLPTQASFMVFALHALSIYGYSTAIVRYINPFEGV